MSSKITADANLEISDDATSLVLRVDEITQHKTGQMLAMMVAYDMFETYFRAMVQADHMRRNWSMERYFQEFRKAFGLEYDSSMAFNIEFKGVRSPSPGEEGSKFVEFGPDGRPRNPQET